MRNYNEELKAFCNTNDLTLNAELSLFTVSRSFPDRQRWVGTFDTAEDACQWLDMMHRQALVYGAAKPWMKPD